MSMSVQMPSNYGPASSGASSQSTPRGKAGRGNPILGSSIAGKDRPDNNKIKSPHRHYGNDPQIMIGK